MTEKELLTMLFDFLKSGGLLSIAAAAVLLKKYVINGSVNRFFDMKQKEIEALEALRGGLLSVIEHQEKLNEYLERRECLK